MAKSNSKKINRQEIKEYRSKLAILKKKGLVKKTIDARSHKPTRYMKSKIKTLDDVIKGNQTALKVSKDVLKKARLENQRIVNNRVLAPALQPAMQAAIRRGEFIEKVTDKKTPKGRIIRTREIDLGKFYSMREFLETFDDHPHDLDRLKPTGMVFAFTYYGNRTRSTFPNAEEMLGQLRYYLTASDRMNVEGDVINEGHDAQLWEGFGLYSVEPTGHWEAEAAYIAQEHKKARRKEYQRRMKQKNARGYEAYLEKEAFKKYKQRQRIKDQGGERYEQIKAKARERARASYERNKAASSRPN